MDSGEPVGRMVNNIPPASSSSFSFSSSLRAGGDSLPPQSTAAADAATLSLALPSLTPRFRPKPCLQWLTRPMPSSPGPPPVPTTSLSSESSYSSWRPSLPHYTGIMGFFLSSRMEWESSLSSRGWTVTCGSDYSFYNRSLGIPPFCCLHASPSGQHLQCKES